MYNKFEIKKNDNYEEIINHFYKHYEPFKNIIYELYERLQKIHNINSMRICNWSNDFGKHLWLHEDRKLQGLRSYGFMKLSEIKSTEHF